MTAADPYDGFVQRAASELTAQGFPRMPASVIMALTATDDGKATAAELGERLGVSAGAISGAIRYLSAINMVRSSIIPGTRRHIYALPERPWYTASLTQPGLYAHIAALLQTEIERLPAGAARDRIGEMAEFFAFIDRRMPQLLEEWNASRSS
jgi:DNA-binding transcriptional regulator GbsR (MarR family)